MNRINITVDEETVRLLKALNRATGICASAAVRRAVGVYATVVERASKQMYSDQGLGREVRKAMGAVVATGEAGDED